MYTQFFSLKQPPFSIAPDPRYLFMSERHREALAHLLYGIGGGGGFVLLTGEIGAGKTTVCRCLLEQIPANCNVAYIFNPKLTVDELLRSICDEFRIRFAHEGPGAATVKDYVDALNGYLMAAHAEGQNNVLIIDEAQNLSADVLEQLRLLTNLETNEHKLLQIILIGQPELRAMLARPELEQLAQRVIARYHLDSLSAQETARYILHRLSVAGLTGEPPIRPKLMRRIHLLTQGVPRRINLLCDRTLLGAYAEGKHEVDRTIVNKAAREVFGNDRARVPANAGYLHYAALGLAAAAMIIGVSAWVADNRSYVRSVIAQRPAAAKNPAGVPVASADAPAGAASPIQHVSVPDTPPNAPPGPQVKDSSGSVRPAGQASAASAVPSDAAGDAGSNSHDANAAYRELARLWGVSVPDGEPCQAARKENLHCYKSSAGLAEIRQLDRPAILALRDDANKTYYALLIGLTNASAVLRIGSTTHSITLVALGRRFRGDFATFWRAPHAYRDTVGSGDRGADVDWLAAQLAKMNGIRPPVANRAFDQTMAMQVREFQSAQGLEVDGIVGPKTFMHLNSFAGIDEPRLTNGAAILNASGR
jgi:general secretion pathway protein A